MNKKYDIAIAYRIYPKVSKVPPVFADNKLKLSELCLFSLNQSLEGVKAKLYVLLDNCPSEYKDLFMKYFDEKDLELIELSGVGNAETFKLQMEILSNQNDSDLIYFAEDDYFYLENQFNKMIDFFNNHKDKVHFVTPYYHSDFESMDLQKSFKNEKILFQSRDWISVASTTMTFLTSKDNLKETYDVFLTYVKNNYDNSMWLSLTKHKVKNPFLLLKYLFSDFYMFKIFAKAYIFCKKQIFFGKKRQLWVPIQTIATHLDNKHLAPNVDWNKKFSDSIGKINFLS